METLLAQYEPHATHLAKRAKTRREAVALRSVVEDDNGREAVTVEESLGKWQPGDELQGDVNFRTLRSLLKLVDEKGFERSPHQVRRPCPMVANTSLIRACVAHSSSSTRYATLRYLDKRAAATPRLSHRALTTGIRARRRARHLPRLVGNAAAQDYEGARLEDNPWRGADQVHRSRILVACAPTR